MKTLSKIPILLGVMGSLLAGTGAVSAATRPEVAVAIQGIEQASDPSAVVTAYANGFAIDRNEPKLYQAYVSRMVDFGLPEMAYRQAQMLTTLDSNNGLAWGVVAYVEARRAQMPEALSAIISAGQFTPNNKFVQRTAGEILAWYDFKADKAQLSASTKDGVARLHGSLATEVAFSNAYETARKAYEAQAGTTLAPAAEATVPNEQEGPSVGAVVTPPETPPPDVYYPDYYYPDYYASGPGWVEPAPWWWWEPAGVFVGFSFVPVGTVFVFDDAHFFHHHHFHHHDGFHVGNVHHDGFFVRDAAGRGAFFGTRARVNPSVANLGAARFHSDPPASVGSGMPTVTAGRSPALHSTGPANVAPTASSSVSGMPRPATGVTSRQAPTASGQSQIAVGQRSVSVPQSATAPAARPVMRAPMSAPQSFGAGLPGTSMSAAPQAPVAAPAPPSGGSSGVPTGAPQTMGAAHSGGSGHSGGGGHGGGRR